MPATIMNVETKPSNNDVKGIFSVLVFFLVAFHIFSALHGHGPFRDIHLGTALHYAATQIDLADTVIVGFNATGTPSLQELPVWQMAAGLAFKLLGPWWGWANVVSLLLFLPCLFPLFKMARLYLDERGAWWVLILFLMEPLVFINAGQAGTDGFCLAVTIWFIYCGMRLVRDPGFKWLALTCALGSLAAISKLPFFMAAGFTLFFLTLWQYGFGLKRLVYLASSGGVAGVIFLLWTRHTDALQAGALFPFVDLRFGQGTTMMFWYFGDWHYRLSAGNWIKGGWRILTALLGSFTLIGLVVLALVHKKGNPLARCFLAAAVLTTLVFTHLVLHHWHYYLMFAPATALLCAEGLGILTARISPQGTKPSAAFFIFGLLGLALLQGLMAMRQLTYDPYPARIAGLIRQHTVPADKLVIVGGGWGGEELFRAQREGLSAWNAHIFDQPEDLAKLKSLGYNKLVLVASSPFQMAVQIVNPGQAGTPREGYLEKLIPQVEHWPTLLQTDDILIKEIP